MVWFAFLVRSRFPRVYRNSFNRTEDKIRGAQIRAPARSSIFNVAWPTDRTIFLTGYSTGHFVLNL